MSRVKRNLEGNALFMWVGRGRCLPPAVFYGGKVDVAVGDKRHLLRLAATRMQAKDALDPISSRALAPHVYPFFYASAANRPREAASFNTLLLHSEPPLISPPPMCSKATFS